MRGCNGIHVPLMHVILVGMKPNGGENTSCVNFRDIPQKMTRN